MVRGLVFHYDDFEVVILFGQPFEQAALSAKPLQERNGTAGGPHDDMSDPVFLCKLQNRLNDIIAFISEDRGSKLAREFQRIVQMALGGRIDADRTLPGSLDVKHIPVPAEPAGDAGSVTQQCIGVRTAGAHAHHDLIRADRLFFAFGDRFLPEARIELRRQFARAESIRSSG